MKRKIAILAFMMMVTLLSNVIAEYDTYMFHTESFTIQVPASWKYSNENGEYYFFNDDENGNHKEMIILEEKKCPKTEKELNSLFQKIEKSFEESGWEIVSSGGTVAQRDYAYMITADVDSTVRVYIYCVYNDGNMLVALYTNGKIDEKGHDKAFELSLHIWSGYVDDSEITPFDLDVIMEKDRKEVYKGLCNLKTYNQIARNPEKVKGEYIKVSGKVVQVIENGDYVDLRVNITKGEYRYNDTVYVKYKRKTKDEDRILENDIVSIWGISDGLYTYQTVMKDYRTIPLVQAEYIEIENL